MNGALVTLLGSFPYEDMVARDYGVNLFIRAVDQETRFVCFSMRWGPMSGDTSRIKRGLDAKVVADMPELATPTDEAHFISIEAGRIEVQMPADFPPGIAEAQFFVLYNGVPVFSNPVPFEIGEAS